MATRFEPPTPDHAVIAAAILASSHVTRLGLACPSEALRERAAGDLAKEIADRLAGERNQFTLAL